MTKRPWPIPWRRVALVLLTVAIPLCPGCRCMPGPREDARYRDGMRHFLAGNPAAAAPRFRDFLADHPSGPRAAEAQYALGAIALRQGQAPEAQARFRDCLRSAPPPALAFRASLGQARCHFQRGAYAECRSACLDLLNANPSNPIADEVLFLLAEACDRLGRGPEARTYYRKIATDFRSSAYAEKAQACLGGGPAALPPASPSGKYYVQVAALASAASAEEHAKMFCERGYPGSVLLTRTSAGALYAVRVGPYASEAEAGRVAARLRAEGFEGIVKP